MSKTEMIKFKLSNCPLFAKKLNVNEKLNEIRAKFQKELPKDSLFFCSMEPKSNRKTKKTSF